ncbi:unnamed protein product [Adineta steineri]|uniref:NAD(P)-binding domain-containing protein n=2 Tax=Adineta steineri TaxID=433720 RepID=A0A819MNL0_9BILA|nr:unnamed protein product [Adineta steineri]CAF3837197.1 unnamed protein product [Adineta steineri]CAF3983363.1 unnamed protein product [Adineta steineri]
MIYNACLVTGGAGFIGSHLIDRLLQSNVGVILLDNFNDYYSSKIKWNNVAYLRTRHPNSTLIVIQGSINDVQLLKIIFATYDITHIAHIAALPGVRSSTLTMNHFVETNSVGTQLLLEMAVSSRRLPLFIFTSTSSVYGQTNKVPFVETDSCDRPISPYAASKRSAELIAHVYHRSHSLNVTILRLFNVYGPRGRPDMMPFKLMNACLDPSYTVNVHDHGEMQRDWTYIDDVVDTLIVALKRPLGYEIINVGYGTPIKLNKFIEVMQRVSHRHIRMQMKKSYRSEPSITHCNNTKARKLLDFVPKTNVSEGLKRTWAWFQREYGANKIIL